MQHSIILFASGRGSNVVAIVDYFAKYSNVNIPLIVCNNPQAGVLTFAEQRDIPVLLIDKAYLSSATFIEKLNSYQPSLLVLAGFLWKVPEKVVQAFQDKIINIHPALLPKYGGKGMYGIRVHEAIKAAKETETGITIHFIDEHYDKGSTIIQAVCQIKEEDSPEDIMNKIQRLEHFFLPRTIAFLLNLPDDTATT